MDAASVIENLGLVPHPEGGWYRETWRAPGREGERAAATAIYFLLKPGERSHWHKVDASEIWLWHAGGPVRLRIADAGTAPVDVMVGPDIERGQQPQAVIAAGQWQAAEAGESWALVSCVVAPGFEFSGFSLAPDGWEPEHGEG
jgi:predicted cupin superfamily sugar epimerase